MSFGKCIIQEYGFFYCVFAVFYKLLYKFFLFPICCLLVRLFCHIDERAIVFESFPDYSDNSRAMSEFIVSHNDELHYKVYWKVREPKRMERLHPNAGVTFCPSRWLGCLPLKSLKIFMTAKYLMGTHGIVLPKKYCMKQQILVRLWHGCSYKDRAQHDGEKPAVFDYACVSGKLFVKPKAYFWNCKEEKILPLGFARYDWLRSCSEKAKAMKRQFVSSGEKVVIWMPTFRNDKKGRYNSYDLVSSFPLMIDEDCWKRLDYVCQRSHVILLIKLHPNQKEYSINFESLTNIHKIDQTYFDNADVPMYEFISVTDALISDYSSISIDFLVVDKPIAFTLDDYNKYKDKRGFIFKEDTLDYMPGHHLYQFEDLVNFIDDVAHGYDRYIAERCRVRKMAIADSSHYCLDIANAIGLL